MPTRTFGSERPVERSPEPDPIQQPDAGADAGGRPEPERESPEAAGGQSDPARADGAVDPAAAGSARQQARDAKRKRNEYHRKYQERKRKAEREASGPDAAASRKAATQATLDLNNILFSMHMMGAAMLKMPSLMITEEESKQLSTAITRVSELYEMPLMDEKTRAWLNLGIVGFQVYGTRVMAEMAERKKKRPAPPPMVISPFRTPPPAPAPPPTMNGFTGEEVIHGQA